MPQLPNGNAGLGDFTQCRRALCQLGARAETMPNPAIMAVRTLPSEPRGGCLPLTPLEGRVGVRVVEVLAA